MFFALSDVLVVVAGLVAGATAAVTGFGIGSLLTPVFADGRRRRPARAVELRAHQRRASNVWLTIVFGVLLLFAAAGEASGFARRMRLRRSVAWMAGALSGLLGGLVGNQGGIRSAALMTFDLPKKPRSCSRSRWPRSASRWGP